jgi:uncharacterized protein YodC (DUF2158 family)
MKLEDFNSGDVVTLKSGSVPMTVRYACDLRAARATERDIGIHCDWQDAAGRPHFAVFTPDQLIITEETASPSSRAEAHRR